MRSVRTSSELPVRVYDADAVHTTVLSSIARAATEISAAREVIWRLFARDFVSQFRQRLLGYAWTLLTPVVGIASFVLLNYAGVLHPGELTVPYPLYVFLGTSVWGLMVGCVMAVSGALLTHGDLVLRTSIPKMALAVSSITGSLYAQVANLVVLGVILVIFGVLPSWGALLLPVMLIPMMILGVGIGLALAVIGAIARDVTNAAATLLGLVMYITPAIYVPMSSNRWLRAAITYNPLTYLVDEPRNLFFHGVIAHPIGFALALLFSVLTLVAGIHAFYLIQDHVAERL
jgi:ABC-type polysaccharide/polyol phosphate export permease